MNAVLPTPRRAMIELDERRRRMLSRATGRVLDVAELPPRGLDRLADSQQRFDTVVSVLQISTAADVVRFCRALAAVVADGGELWFLEPTSVTGAVGALQHALGPWMRRTTGRRPDHDVPRVLRETGWTISDLERFEARALWPYRSFVEGVARLAVRVEEQP